MLDAKILIDNIAYGDFISEWGLSVYIEYGGKKILLDTGKSANFSVNAKTLGISLEDIDFSVLSHAHYDHSSGYDEFFSQNKKAPLYVSENCEENCYFKFGFAKRYIGLPKGLLEKYPDRIIFAKGFTEICDGVWIVPHLGQNLEKIGRKAHLHRKSDGKIRPDDFCHEQSLVFDTDKGLVVFNSCSHAGLENILSDVAHFFPDKKVYMTVGGLHLSKYSDSYVRKIARKIKSLKIEKVVTGHCTGDRAFEILKQELGEAAVQTYSGMKISV